ncbi:transglutaminase family protein [Ferruginibacter yonginensis]|uniref:Transglutaminase family protein n=1 Tax=Ferruginibacter yonginensis TaxID=1310416 RepID=A0ABV8QPA9_9BACT
MQENSEIKALLQLIDDPDEVVYETVSTKIMSLGKAIIPNLEHFSETSINTELQAKIERLIQQLHFEDLKADFIKWNDGSPDLLSGAMLVAKFVYPDVDVTAVLKDIDKLRRNIWLEMNSYLTPMEQINVVGSILYNYYKQRGIEINYNNPDGFLINKVLEKQHGNAFGNGTLLLILFGLLDVPVYAINIPQQFILGYFDSLYDVLNPVGHASEKIKFYIDPINGQMYSHKDVENYFKKIAVPPTASFFKPINNKNVIITLLTELQKCYTAEDNAFKNEQISSLINIIAA